MLELERVSKTYNGIHALKPTSLSFTPRKTTVLIGPSGCGKSTMLRILIGLIHPDGGAARFDGATITPETVATVRRRMGYVIQEGGLFPHLCALDNIALMARHIQRPEDEIARRIDELTDLTQFPGDALERFPAQLSGGQRQRVSLMRALMLDPDVLLLDEPLGALDPMIRSELQTDLREIFWKLGKTVVMVTHDMGEAGFFGHVIVMMRGGEIIQSGTLAELVNAPADSFVTRFINAQRSPLDSMSGGVS